MSNNHLMTDLQAYPNEQDRRTAFASLQREADEAQREAEREGWIPAELIRRVWEEESGAD